MGKLDSFKWPTVDPSLLSGGQSAPDYYGPTPVWYMPRPEIPCDPKTEVIKQEMRVVGAGCGNKPSSPAMLIYPIYRAGSLSDGPLGVGWSAGYFETVVYNSKAKSYIVRAGDGSALGFAQAAPFESLPLGAGPACVKGIKARLVGPPDAREQLTTTSVSTVSCAGSPAVGAMAALPGLDYRRMDGTVIHFEASKLTPGLYLPTLLTDRNGNNVVYARDSQERLSKLTDVHGRTVAFGYQGRHVTSVKDNKGQQIFFAYDAATGDKLADTSLNGDVTRYSYDRGHRITKIAYPNGGVKLYTYDQYGRVKTESDGEGNNKLTYDADQPPGASSGRTTVTDILGRRVVYNWKDFRGWPKPTSIVDPAGNAYRFVYDQQGRLVESTDPRGRVTKATYDAAGNLASLTDPAGHTASATYEPVFNQPLTLTDPKGHLTSMAYDAAGNLLSIKDWEGKSALMSYDPQGHVTSVKAPDGTATMTYDKLGALASVIDPLGRTAKFDNDELSRVTKMTDPTGHKAELSYDPEGNVTQVRAPMAGVTRLEYAAGRGSRALASLADARGQVTRVSLDALGRTTRVTNPLNESEQSAYDPTGRQTSVTTRQGRNIRLSYDVSDRLTQVNLPEGKLNAVYDRMDNVLSVDAYNGSRLAMRYDGLDHIERVTQTLPNGFSVIIGYGYDAAGNRTAMSTPWGNYTYTYDVAERITSIKNPQGETISFAYDSIGRRKSMAFPNGVTTSYAFDQAGRLEQISHAKGDKTLAFAKYSYDVSGYPVRMTDAAGAHDYAYDELHRLVLASHPAASGLLILNERFSYDAVGNRNSDSGLGGYRYDAANRLVENSGFTYAYDADGNQTDKTERGSRSHTAFSYDSLGELLQLSLPAGGAVKIKYGAAGRLVERLADGSTLRYVYDGDRVLAILDGSNGLAALFTNGPGLAEPLSMRRDGKSSFYQADALGSVTALTDENGRVVESYQYQAFGRAVVKDRNGLSRIGPTAGNRLLFAGAEFDPEAGLYHMGFRYLDPDTGRFLQEDPVRRINQYAYAGNNPISFIDPLGLDPTTNFGLNFLGGFGNGLLYLGRAGDKNGWGANFWLMALNCGLPSRAENGPSMECRLG